MGDIAEMCLDYSGSGWEESWHGQDGPSSSNINTFEKDELFYHRQYKHIEILHETDSAYLFKHKKGDFWCPKKLVKFRDGKIYIWKKFKKTINKKKNEKI